MRVLNRTATRATGARVALRRAGVVMAVAATAAALSVTSAPLAAAAPALTGPTLQTVTFTSPASVASWTVPGDASTTVELMISATGGQGGRGGYDGGTTPAPGGYVGVVSGTVTVPGGTTLLIAVGAGGAGGANSATNGPGGNGGANTFGGYAGGKGGTTGSLGTSGAGGGGGAATVVKLAGRTVVAGGAGGGGGSGNGGVLTGRAAEAAFSPDHASGNTNGTVGASVPTSGNQLDGGGAGGGGGGESGGAGGHIEYGSGLSMEWFGYGGYPGGNATGGYGTLDGSYQYYSGNGANGSVTIKYVDGPPAPAQNVIGQTGTAAGSVELSWQAPVNSGLTAVTGYKVQVSPDGGTTWQDAVLAAGSPAVTADGGKATVTGLAGSEEYIFRVAAQNGYDVGGGWGGWSVPSAAVTAAAGGGDVPDSPWGADGADTGDTGAENAHVVPGDGTITVTWDDGTAPAEYTVHVYDEHGDEAGSSPRTCAGGDCTVSGLDPEGEYTVVIETPGAETDPAVAVGPHQPDPNVQPAPGDWNGANVTRKSDGSIEVAWPAPAVPPADSYRLYVYDASGDPLDPPVTQDCSAASCTVGGLDPDLDYQIAYSVLTPGENESDPPQEGTPSSTATVSAYDDNVVSNTTPSGWTDASGENSVITRNDDGTITVDWTSPASPPNSDYLLHVYDEDGEVAGSPFPCTGGSACTSGYLDPATSYEVTIEVPNRTAPSREVNPGTDQTWTDPQDPVRVVTGPPTNLGTTARDRALAVSFTAPAAQPAGNAILYYQYSLDGGATWANSGAFASPANVSGLVNGTAYSVQLRAMTLQGPGVASAAVAGTPRSYPSAPYSGSNPAGISVVSRSGGSVTVNWDPYSPNGAAISSYTLTAFNAATAGSASGTCSVAPPAHSCTINGLSATGTYYLSVQAQNAVGASPRSDPRIKLVMNAAAPGAPGKPVASGGTLSWEKPTGTSDAYLVQYSTDGGTTWATAVPSSGPTTSGDTVTAGLSSLAGGMNYVFRVQGLNGALAGPWSPQSDAVTVAVPATPAFGPVTSTPGGYTVQITNYDAALGWSVSVASPGAATVDGSGKVTVTGLAASQSATVTVTATGFGTRSGATNGSALGGTAPILSAATPIDKGFTVQIVNWSEYKNGRYGPHTVFTSALSGGGTASGPNQQGLITISGLADGASTTISLSVKSDAHTEVTSQPVTGTSLLAAAALSLTGLTPTSDGFTVTISPFDGTGAKAYSLGVTAGTVAGPDVNGVVTVSGLGAGDGATLTVTAQQDGHVNGTAQVSGTALADNTEPPEFSEASRTRNGFSTVLTIPSSWGTTLAGVTVSDGAVVQCGETGNFRINGPILCASGTMTVSGIAPGATATMTASLYGPHSTQTAIVTGQALFAGIVPEFGSVVSTLENGEPNGFTVNIANWGVFMASGGHGPTVPYSSAYEASKTHVKVKVDAVDGTPSVQCGPDGVVNAGVWTECDHDTIAVTGLSGGQQAKVTVEITDDNHSESFAVITGTASSHFTNYAQTSDGYSVDLADYDDDVTYAVEVDGVDGSGPTADRTDGTITVSGLSPSASATIVVTATDAESHEFWVESFTGQALANAYFINYQRADDGFSIGVKDYNPGPYLYFYAICDISVTTWDDCFPQVSLASAVVTASGLAPGVAKRVFVRAMPPGPPNDGWLSTFDGTARPAVGAFVLAEARSIQEGFETSIDEDDYDSSGDTSYALQVTDPDGAAIAGAEATRVGRFITVTGLRSGEPAEVTVTASKTGYVAVSESVTGQPLADPAASLTLTTPIRTATGYKVAIDNRTSFNSYDLGSTHAIVMVDHGASVECRDSSDDITVPQKVNGPVVCGLDETVIVSGVASGGIATVTVALSDKAHLETTATATGQARFAGVAPEIGAVERTADGFTTSISNWATFKDPSLTATGTEAYVAAKTTVSATVTGVGASSPSISGPDSAGKITVTGLTSEQQAIVKVTVTESDGNHTDSGAARQGQALAAGISPTFDQATSLVKSFSVRLAGDTYDATASYTITATEGGGGTGAAIPAKDVSFNSGTRLITVTGLADGAQATVRVQVAAAGKLPAEASHTGTALKAPVTPILAVRTNTATGFTVRIVNGDAFSTENYGSGTTFVPAVTPQGGDTGVHVDPNGDGTFTVSGVPTGHTATLTITVKQADHPDAVSDAVTGTALYPGVAPTLGSPTRTADGFRVPITNYTLYTADGDPTVDGDDGSRYGDGGQFAITVTAVSPGGTALGDVKAIVLQPDGILQVSGLAYGQTATVELTAGDGLTKHQDATAPELTGQALAAAVPLSLGSVTQTADGFIVALTGRDPDATYTVTSSAGSASLSGGAIVVTGLRPGESASVTVSVSKSGHVSGSAGTSGSALKAGTAPGSGAPVQREGGFTARITPFDKDASYTAAVSGAPGASVKVSGDTVTVSGMKPGDTVTVTITQTKDGFAPVTTTITYTLPADTGTAQDPSGGATPPDVPELKPGQTAVTVNGVPVPAQTSVGPNGVTVTWQGMTMTAVHVVGGKPVPPATDGSEADLLTVPFTGSVKVDVSGFAPDSRVQLWAFSTPTLLGTFTSQSDARGIITVDLPMAVIVGDHTLVASGVNRAGEHVTMSTAMRVTPLADEAAAPVPGAADGQGEIAYTGTRTFDELRIAAGLLVLGLGLVALSHRRRRSGPPLAPAGAAGGFGPVPESLGQSFGSGGRRSSADSREGTAAMTLSVDRDAAGHLDEAGTAAPVGPLPLIDVTADADGPACPPPAAAPAALPQRRFIPPREVPSTAWVQLRAGLGLTRR